MKTHDSTYSERDYHFFDRDVSWLSFNDRVLAEAQKEHVPLKERINFLSIFSSNLDEFYRVRMPALLALHQLGLNKSSLVYSDLVVRVNHIIYHQQETFGKIMAEGVLPALKQRNVHLLYNEPIPDTLREVIHTYFFNEVATFLQIVDLEKQKKF